MISNVKTRTAVGIATIVGVLGVGGVAVALNHAPPVDVPPVDVPPAPAP